MSSEIQQIVQELGTKRTPMVQLKAAKDLVNLYSETEDKREEAAAAGAIPALVKLLTASRAAVQENAVRGLVALVASSTHATQAAAAGAIPLLVHLLKSPLPALQEQAARALAAISRGQGAAAQMVSAGAIPALVQLLKVKSVEVQAAGAEALSLMQLTNPDSQAQLAAAGAIPVLVGFLVGPSTKQLQRTALLALISACHKNDGNTASVARAGGLPALARLLGGRGGPAVQELAAIMVKQLVRDSSGNVQGLVDAGAIPPLLQLLAAPPVPNHNTQQEAAWAFAVVCAGSAGVKAAAVSAGAIPALVTLLRATCDDTKRSAIRALASLCDGDAGYTAAAASAGAVAALKPLLDAATLDVVEPAAELFALIAVPPAADAAAAVPGSAGAIPSLVRLLASPLEDVKEAAAAALADLCENDETRGEAAAAIPSLVQLLGSPSNGAQQQAARALMEVCEGIPGNQVRAIAAGAMGPLLQLMDASAPALPGEEPSARSKVAEAAKRALFKFDLSETDVLVAMVGAGAMPLLGRRLEGYTGEGYRYEKHVLSTMLESTHEEQMSAAMQESAPVSRELLGSPSAEVADVEVAAVLVLVSSLFRCIGLGKELDRPGWAGWSDGEQEAAARAARSASPAMEEAFERLEEGMERFRSCSPPAAPPCAAPPSAAPSHAAPSHAVPVTSAAPAGTAELGATDSAGRQDPGTGERAAYLHALAAAASCWDVAARALLRFAARHQLGAAQPPGEEPRSWRGGNHESAASRQARELLSRLLFCAMTLLAALTVRVSALAFKQAFHRDVFDPNYSGSLHILVRLLGSEREAAQLLATKGICGFSHMTQFQTQLYIAGAVPALWRLLGSCSAAALPNLVSALSDLTVHSPYQEQALVAAPASGALPHLAKLLSSPSLHSPSAKGHEAEKTLWWAALMLRNVCAFAPANSTATDLKAAVAPGAIPSLVQLLGSASVVVQEQAAAALAGICYQADKQVAAELLKAGAVSTLVERLGSPSPAVQQEAAEALMNIAADHGGYSGQNMVASAGAIPPLVRLLSSGVEAVQLRACGALRNICCSGDDYQTSLVSAGAVSVLVRLLESASASLQESAAGALRNIFLHAADPTVDAAAAGAIAPLVQLLRSASAAVQEHAAGALRNILFNEGNGGNKALVMTAGAVPLLQGLMGSQSAAVQEQARAALQNMRCV